MIIIWHLIAVIEFFLIAKMLQSGDLIMMKIVYF